MNKFLLTVALWMIHFSIQAQTVTPLNFKAAVDSFLQTTYSDSLPGAAVAIVQNNKVVFEKSYGVRNTNTHEKISTNTSFNIASLTKQFTAMAILQLAEHGKLSLTDKIALFFPDMNKTVGNKITVYNLLTHTSGIVDHYAYADVNHLQHAHNADVYDAIKNTDSLYFTPGTQFRYSNTGFCLLALIIETVSGMPYSSYMKSNIFKPAGMQHTTIWNENVVIAEPATGYEWDSTRNAFMESGAAEHIFFSTEGDGGIYTSVNDYLQWLRALQNKTVFNKSAIEKARSIKYTINKTQRLGYGFGWFVDDSGAAKKVYHSGSNGGFRTYSFTIPQQGFSIVIFSNRADIDVEAITEQINKILCPNNQPFTLIEALTS